MLCVDQKGRTKIRLPPSDLTVNLVLSNVKGSVSKQLRFDTCGPDNGVVFSRQNPYVIDEALLPTDKTNTS